jgi:hypothetical protein
VIGIQYTACRAVRAARTFTRVVERSDFLSPPSGSSADAARGHVSQICTATRGSTTFRGSGDMSPNVEALVMVPS